MQAHSLRLGLCLVVPEDDRDLDLAGAEQLQGLGWMGVGQRDLQVGMLLCERGQGAGHQRPDRRGEAGQPYPTGVQPDVRGQLRVGRIQPTEDLGSPGGQEIPGGGEPDTASDALEELRARFGLEPREVVADRRL